MSTPINSDGDAYDVRDLARRGILAKHVHTLPGPERRRLRINAYELLWRVVFQHLTRKMEVKRGHHACASSVHRLEPACLDRFYDDVDAVLDDLFRNAKEPIFNLEGWATKRLTAATVDAYRRRRGERGALQRPRLPGWLTATLDGEPQLMKLAVDMLVWVGVETTAGPGMWPLDVWADHRAIDTGDYGQAYRVLAHDVETVLIAMRQRPEWYANFVERPLGRKQTPLAAHAAPDWVTEPACLALTERHEIDDARLVSLAVAAIGRLTGGLSRGEDPRTVVVDVLTSIFRSSTGSEDLDRCPGADDGIDDRVAAILTDPVAIARIVAAVRDILSE